MPLSLAKLLAIAATGILLGAAGAAMVNPLWKGQSGPSPATITIMRANGCAGCHTIPGIPGAQGVVGPRLDRQALSAIYIAGILPNKRENLVRWIKSPRQIAPRTAMPSTGITDREAGQIADYLYSL
jgi:mono/diheme cytochrome c family protein